MALEDKLQAALRRRADRGMLRRLTHFSTPTVTDAADDETPSASSSSRAFDEKGGALSEQAKRHGNSRALIDFSSNDYLSLSTSIEVRDKFVDKMLDSGRVCLPLGSTGSRLLDGNTAEHEALENRLASFFTPPSLRHPCSALLFNSGFDANVSLFSVLPQPGDVIVYDELIHASVHDGMRASRAAAKLSFAHNDVSALETVLERLLDGQAEVPEKAKAKAEDTKSTQLGDSGKRLGKTLARRLRSGESTLFLAVESLYSMDGDYCPLSSILRLLAEILPAKNYRVILDEAHTTGLLGPRGRGLYSTLCAEEQTQISVRLHTFGKALGSHGAVVIAMEGVVREYLINYARPLIYSTAMSVSNVLSIETAFDVLESGEGERRAERLRALCDVFLVEMRSLLRQTQSGGAPQDRPKLSLPPTPPASSFPTPIIPLLTPYPRRLTTYMQHCGFLARPITYPTVPKGQERVRICLHSGNTVGEVRALVRCIRAWLSSEEASVAAAAVAVDTRRDTISAHIPGSKKQPTLSSSTGSGTDVFDTRSLRARL